MPGRNCDYDDDSSVDSTRVLLHLKAIAPPEVLASTDSVLFLIVMIEKLLNLNASL